MSTFSELIDFTRSSTGTYLDSVVYGDEIITNGDFSNGLTGWDNESEGTGTATVVNEQLVLTRTDASNRGRVDYQHTLETGKSYKLQFEIVSGTAQVKYKSSGSLSQYFNGENWNQIGVGIYTTVFVADGTDGEISIMAISSGSHTVDNITLVKVTSTAGGTPLLRTADTNEPRLEYDASGQPLGLLIEESRTNVLAYSKDFTTGWGAFNIVTTPNIIASPDGAVSGARLQEDSSGTGGPRFYPTALAVLTANQAQTFSCFFKAGTSNYAYVTIRHSNQNIAGAEFDLANGTVNSTHDNGNMTVNGSDITSVGNGWYRCSVTATCSVSTSSGLYFLGISDGTGILNGGYPNYALTGKNIYAWGAQLEAGSFPTSYIPTSGSTVTRNSDLAPIPVERFAFDASEGTLFVHAVTAAGLNTTTGQCAVSMSSGATANCYRLRKNVSTEEIGMLKRVGDSNVININGKIVGETSTFKACGNYSATDLNLSIDGEDVITGSASSSTITISKLDVGTSPFGDADCFNGHIKRIQYFPKRLSNDELVELTKPSSSPTMSLTFDGQATSELVEGLHD